MKKHLIITAQRCIIIALLFLLLGIAGFAQVSVANTATTYSTKQISFTVSWTSAPHNNQIWVIVDYIKIENATTVGSWSRATVTAVSASGNGSAATVTGQRGFWLNTSGSSGSATITATLSLASGVDKFNWCAYALNYPPQAVIKAAGGYDLKGTPPFTVNGTTLGAGVTTFGAGTCITSLSDATNNPTFVLPATLTVTTSNPAARCSAGAVTLSASASGGTTTAMTYTWVVGGGAEQTTTTGSLSHSAALGSTTYSVTVTNANGCTSAQKTGTITVNIAVAQATITGAASNTCPSVTVSLSASASGATTYTWYKNNSQVQTSTSGNYTVTASGSYTVQGKNANCTGTNSSQKVITIKSGSLPSCACPILYQTTAYYEGAGVWTEADKLCKDNGARLPTITELECMCSHKSELANKGGYTTNDYYWSSTYGSLGYIGLRFNDACSETDHGFVNDDILFVRCVK